MDQVWIVLDSVSGDVVVITDCLEAAIEERSQLNPTCQASKMGWYMTPDPIYRCQKQGNIISYLVKMKEDT